MCENFLAAMSTDALPNLKTRKILFASLLAIICIALVYAAFHNSEGCQGNLHG